MAQACLRRGHAHARYGVEVEMKTLWQGWWNGCKARGVDWQAWQAPLPPQPQLELPRHA